MPVQSALAKRFAVVGAILCIVALTTSAWFHVTTGTAQMKRMAQENNAALTLALSNALQDDLLRFLGAADGVPASELSERAQRAGLHDAVRRVMKGTNVVKVKIYSRTGLTVFSTDPGQIGENKSDNSGFRSAIGGRIASDLTFRDRFDAFEGTIAHRDLLYSYIPLWADGERRETAGVFEVYSDVTDLRQQIQWAVTIELVVLGAAFLFVYVLLLYIVFASGRTLARQHAANLALAEGVARAEAASRAKTEFLMNMSHELRTPLNAIIGFSELIKDERFGAIAPARYRDYAEDIHKSGTHLLGIVNDLLDLVRVEAGRIEASLADMDPAAVVRDAVQIVRPRAEAAKLALDVEIAAGLPPTLRSDERRLRQVLVNLLGNAIKFTPEGGRIAVRADAVSSGAPALRIAISDTGIGIAPEHIALCLSPFGQVDSSLARRFDGVGLGLPLSRKFVELLGGTLAIDSTLGQGTTVTITLPLGSAEEAGDLRRAA